MSVSALTSLFVGVVSLFAVCISALALSLLKPFLNEKTAPFAKITIALGAVGVLSMLASLFMKQTVDSVAVFLPLISVTTVLLTDTNHILEQSLESTLKHSALIGGLSADFLLTVGVLREFLGAGSFFGLDIYTKLFSPAEFFLKPAGALLIAAFLAIGYNLLASLIEKRCAK